MSLTSADVSGLYAKSESIDSVFDTQLSSTGVSDDDMSEK